MFDLNEVQYGGAIEKAGWKVRFRPDLFDKKMMAEFLDIYGNEAHVLIDATEFRVNRRTGKDMNRAKER